MDSSMDRTTTTVTSATADSVVGAMNSMAALATSNEIRDRGSTFAGHIYRARTTEEANALVGRCRQRNLERMKKRERPGRHQDEKGKERAIQSGMDVPMPYTIAAWRCMVVRAGRTGLGGPDEFEVEAGSDDGGERYAGKRVLAVMQREAVIDAVVIVSRRFGGTLLGPIRFDHVETCAGEVCRKFRKIEEMEECIQTLERLDDVLATLRAQMLEQTNPNSSPQAKSKGPDYRIMQQDLDLDKAKRLIHARECAIQNTKTLIKKHRSPASTIEAS